MTITYDIVTEYKGKGTKDAEKSLLSLDGTAKKLAKTIGKTFAAYQILKFGKAAATAFAKDEASAASLANTMKNLNAQLSIPAAETAIAKLQQMTAVADDDLRPAFAQLFRILGSVTEASSKLGLATEISRGTGESLATVVDAITKAYAGNTKGLLALNTGLTKAEINSGDMQMIMEKLNSMFAGSNAAYLDTYAGKMQALSVTAGDAMEIIGAGIFDALSILSGSTDIEVIQQKVTDFAKSISGFITGIATFFKGIYDNILKPIINALTKTYEFLQKIGVIKKSMGEMSWGNVYGDPAAQAAAANDKKLAAQRLAQEKKLQAEQKRAAAAKLKAERDAQTLKKAGTLLDIDKIQIIAALQGKISNEEKLRLQLQFALLVDNASEADRLSNELAKSQLATTDLALAIAQLPAALNPFASYPQWIQDAINEINKLKSAQSSAMVYTPTPSTVTPSTPVATISPAVSTAAVAASAAIANPQTSLAGYQAYRAGERASINVTVQGNVISNKDLADTIRMQLLDSSASGSFTMSNRATRGD
jgi:hypothetical protein